MAHGKNLAGAWTLRVASLPDDRGVNAIGGVFLLLRAGYPQA